MTLAWIECGVSRFRDVKHARVTPMQTELQMSVPERLAFARRRAGLEQAELASQLGVARGTLSEWERGNREPKLSQLVMIAELADVSLDWLCARRDSNPQPSDP